MTHKTSKDASLASTAYEMLPLGDVQPKKWLYKQLRLQTNGKTGPLEELWPDVAAVSTWLGGNGEDWERGPYYLDGLIPLTTKPSTLNNSSLTVICLWFHAYTSSLLY